MLVGTALGFTEVGDVVGASVVGLLDGAALGFTEVGAVVGASVEGN